MLAPGSKGWINKYFELVNKKAIVLSFHIPEGLNNKEFIHFTLLKSGIVFGFPGDLLFAKNLDTQSWTYKEKLKVLLFESMLLIYEQERGNTAQNKDLFKFSLLEFYGNHNAHAVGDIFKLFLKETEDERIEKVLSQRLAVKGTILESKFWVNYLSNSFVYLDVILYREFLRQRKDVLSEYSDLAQNALTVISMSAFADGQVNEVEKKMFETFLASSNLKDKQKAIAIERFKKGATMDDFTEVVHTNWLFGRFLIDFSAFTIFAHQSKQPDEYEFFENFCEHLQVPKKEINSALAMIENFVLQNNDKIEFLKNSSSYEMMYSNMSKRWIKILGRNKDKLATELKESKELVYLITKSTKEELTKEEKETVKAQFLDIIKSMPALAIFMLPGGALLLPLVLKVIPDLIPSAFRDNELEE
jgi:ribosomal protein L7/L12